MYHRVAAPAFDPWQLCVSAENFNEQVSILKQEFNVVSVGELVQQLKNGHVVNNSVCITFDDGYADNYLSAKPVLEKYHCPATFFIATDYIGSQQLFWWDLLQDIMLGSPQLPDRLELTIWGKNTEYHLTDTVLTPGQLEAQKNWQWPAKAPTGRCRLYLSVWEQLLPLEIADIHPALEQIKQWASYKKEPAADEVPMTKDQLQRLSADGLFSLGIHTSSHAALPFHHLNYQLHELDSCRSFLQANFSNTVNAVAYPYGRYNTDTITAAGNAGIDAGFTTRGELVNKRSGILSLGRMQVGNWDGDTLNKQVKEWFKHA